MRALKTFFRTLFKSSTDPQYYQDVIKAPASFSWKYFIFLNFLISLGFVVLVMIPLALFDLSGAITMVADQYPDELVMQLEDGQLTINQELPYEVPMPGLIGFADPEVPDSLVLFVSEEAFNFADFYEYDSVAVVTPNMAHVWTEDEIRSYDFDEFQFEEPLMLDDSMVQSFASSISDMPIISQRWYVPVIGIALFMVLFPMMTLIRLLMLLIYTVAVKIAAIIFMKDKELSFGKLYQLSFHSITPVMLLAVVLTFIGLGFLEGIWHFLAFFAWTFYILSQIDGEGSQSVAAKAKKKTTRMSAVTKNKTSTKSKAEAKTKAKKK